MIIRASAIRVAGIFVLFTAAIVGCTRRVDDKWTKMRPQVFPATGTVTYQGKPCAGATVMFEANSPDEKARGKVAIGHTDSAGGFRMKTFKEYEGVVAGPHRISITKSEFIQNLPPNPDPTIDYPLIEKPLLPAKYKEFQTSGLTVDVSPDGPNSFLLTLE
jgi:hypothetical protein